MNILKNWPLLYWMYIQKLLRTSDNAFRRSRTNQDNREMLLRRLIAMSEQEKATLAREVHDELGSHLMLMRINLTTALDTFGQKDPELAKHIEEALQLLKNAVDCKRRIVENLRPSTLDNLGLAASIHAYCEQVASCSGIQIDVNVDKDFTQPDPERSIALYRIIQESLTNTIKYAKATKVSIELKQFKHGIRLHISDNGQGIIQEKLKNPTSFGILGMRERAVLNGGNFAIYPDKKEGGTHIDVFMPRTNL